MQQRFRLIKIVSFESPNAVKIHSTVGNCSQKFSLLRLVISRGCFEILQRTCPKATILSLSMGSVLYFENFLSIL